MTGGLILQALTSGGDGGGNLGTKTVTSNGVYNATDDNLDGYSSVTVNVPTGYVNYLESLPIFDERGGIGNNYHYYIRYELTENINYYPIRDTRVQAAIGDTVFDYQYWKIYHLFLCLYTNSNTLICVVPTTNYLSYVRLQRDIGGTLDYQSYFIYDFQTTSVTTPITISSASVNYMNTSVSISGQVSESYDWTKYKSDGSIQENGSSVVNPYFYFTIGEGAQIYYTDLSASEFTQAMRAFSRHIYDYRNS